MNLNVEVWRAIPGHAGILRASSLGRVKMLPRRIRFVSKNGNEAWRVTKERILPPQKINSGYLIVHFFIGGTQHAKTVHSLVAAAFIGPRPTGFDVCHNNGDRLDNRPENLRYDTRASNHRDKKTHGTVPRTGRTTGLLTARLIRYAKKEQGLSNRELAALFGLREGHVGQIIRREIWVDEGY